MHMHGCAFLFIGMLGMLEIRPRYCSHIADVACYAKRLAKSHNTKVCFVFNGIRLYVTRKTSVASVVWMYEIRYSQTIDYTARRRRAAELAVYRQEAQVIVDACMHVLRAAVNDVPMLMQLLVRLIPVADVTGVVYDKVELASVLEQAGYVANDCVGMELCDMSNAMRERWLVGQVLGGLRSSFAGIHPLLASYAASYPEW